MSSVARSANRACGHRIKQREFGALTVGVDGLGVCLADEVILLAAVLSPLLALFGRAPGGRCMSALGGETDIRQLGRDVR
jgi:hypothetical protein